MPEGEELGGGQWPPWPPRFQHHCIRKQSRLIYGSPSKFWHRQQQWHGTKHVKKYIRKTAFFKSIYFIICRPKLWTALGWAWSVVVGETNRTFLQEGTGKGKTTHCFQCMQLQTRASFYRVAGAWQASAALAASAPLLFATEENLSKVCNVDGPWSGSSFCSSFGLPPWK